MPAVIDSSRDVTERRLQRLDDRYRRAQVAVAGARARYSALRESAGATTTQLFYAQRRVEEAQRYLSDLQVAIERTEERPAAS